MMQEHPTEQPVHSLLVCSNDKEQEFYEVGNCGVTRIEPFEKSGLYSQIAYVRVWKENAKGEEFVHSEFCQHNVVGLYFQPPN